MSKPQLVWTFAAAVVTTLGVAVAWFLVPAVAVSFAIIAALAAWVVLSLRPVVPPPARIATVAVAAAAVTVATAGLIRLAGPVGLAVAGLLALTAPPSVAALRDLHRRRQSSTPARRSGLSTSEPVTGQQGPSHGDPERPRFTADPNPYWSECWKQVGVTTLPDEALCRAWQASYIALHRRPPGDHPAIASFRAALLDELQARHPAAFNRWIDAGARAASNPGRYVLEPPNSAS